MKAQAPFHNEEWDRNLTIISRNIICHWSQIDKLWKIEYFQAPSKLDKVALLVTEPPNVNFTQLKNLHIGQIFALNHPLNHILCNSCYPHLDIFMSRFIPRCNALDMVIVLKRVVKDDEWVG